MKVLYIVSSFPRNEKDTYVRWLLETTKRLSERGVEITVLAPSYKGLKSHCFGKVKVERFRYFFRKFEDLTHEEGMPTKIKNHWYKLIFLAYFVAGLIQTLRICSKNKFDIIHVHWPFPHVIWAFLGARKNKSKVILTFYAAELLLVKRKFKFLRLLMKWIVNRADKVVTFSTYIKDLIREYDKIEVEIIPYGATIQERKFKVKKNKEKRILFVGRLIERKGVKYLVEAMPKILEKVDSRLIIIGDGGEKKNLERYVRQLNLNKKIKFLGKVSDRRLEEEYKKCDVFVLPAIVDSKGDTEGLGVVLIEALMYKKPIVASDVGGIKDVVINNKTGLLIQERNIKELAGAIINIVKNSELAKRLGNEGYRYVKKKFDWDRIINKFCETYKGVLTRK